MLNQAKVIPNDQYYITTYEIEIVEPTGEIRIAEPILGAVHKGKDFNEEENARQQNFRIPVTVFK